MYALNAEMSQTCHGATTAGQKKIYSPRLCTVWYHGWVDLGGGQSGDLLRLLRHEIFTSVFRTAWLTIANVSPFWPMCIGPVVAYYMNGGSPDNYNMVFHNASVLNSV